MFRLYSPQRLWQVFTVLLTLYLLIRKRERFVVFRPLTPPRLLRRITELGTSFVKLAQVLATRSDFFPPPYLAALRDLHDALPPMKASVRDAVFKRAFPMDPFAYFDPLPIASASIGQVHAARLNSGEKVAVKLRREGIGRRVAADVRILRTFNRLFRPLFSHYTKHSVETVIEEFADMIVKEASMSQERNNLETFARTFADCGAIYPEPVTALCSDDALVMTFIEGHRFDDARAMHRHGIDVAQLIERLVNFYTEQMLVRGFFHADPHPGNLLVTPQGGLCLLDFGMVKRVPDETRVAIIELIKAANERDYAGFVGAAKRLGTVGYDAPAGPLAEFTEQMFTIFENDALDSASMQELAFDVLDRTRNLPFKLPQEAIYILRVSAIIEGLGTAYIENFNGIKDILPILQRNIPRALGVKATILETIADEFRQLPADIMALRSTLRRADRGELAVLLSPLQLDAIRQQTAQTLKPVITGILLLFSALFLLLIDPGYDMVSLTLFTLGAARIVFR